MGGKEIVLFLRHSIAMKHGGGGGGPDDTDRAPRKRKIEPNLKIRNY